MSKLCVAICDAEDGYRNRFVTYLMEHKAKEMAVCAFSAVEAFLEALKEQHFDVTLLGRGFEAAEKAVREKALPVLLLKEDMPMQVAEADSYERNRQAVVTVFRYQSMEAILHEMQVVAGTAVLRPAEVHIPESRMEVVGVYSPVHHEMQIPFSVVFADFMAKKRRVLYVNLMEHPGFLELFGWGGEYDMGDIILRLRNHRLLPETFLRSVYEVEGISYIPPFACTENLHELLLEDYLAFLEFLEERTDFEMVIIDFGEGVNHLQEMLERCTSVYCPVKGGFFFECQVNQFLNELENANGGIKERLHMFELPFSAKQIRGGNVLRQLLWSEFGDYVRNYLTGADHEDT